MAQTRVGGRNGNFTLAGFGIDFAVWEAEVSQVVDDTTNYTDGAWGSAHGSGVSIMTLQVAGFVNKGATGTQPQASDLSGEAVAFVATADTGCTFTGTGVPSGTRYQHGKTMGAMRVSVPSVRSTGTVTTAWAVS